jgi:hypothetical protein
MRTSSRIYLGLVTRGCLQQLQFAPLYPARLRDFSSAAAVLGWRYYAIVCQACTFWNF